MYPQSDNITRPWTRQSHTTSVTRTGQSRPGTAIAPTTAATSRFETSFIIALLEGRGIAREVGLAALDRDTGRAVLIQLVDCQTYLKTLHQMHLHNPILILIPDTFLSSKDNLGPSSGNIPSSTSLLVQCIYDEFPGVPVEPVLRKYWSEDAGLEFVSQLCVQDEERAATILAVSRKYYALSAASAVFKYVEIKLNTRFSVGSLRIRFVPVEGTMMIDPETARNLEIVDNFGNARSPYSLFSLLNHCSTPMARRLLRATLLAPVTVEAALEARLDLVEELVQSEDRFTEVKDALKHLCKVDIDKLISSLASNETREASSARTASSRVTQMLNLRDVVRHLPALQKALVGSTSELLKIICNMLSDERLEKIERLVSESLNEDASLQKTGIGAINARVYAVKANFNPLLDVARETYKENVGDIHALHGNLTEKYGLPIQLVYQESGFLFAIRKGDFVQGKLPLGFTNLSMQRGRWVFTSMELKKRNARMKDALEEALILSHSTIQDLVSAVLVYTGALYKASEAIAMLDVLWSFAHISIIRPQFTGTLAIKSGRHPILENIQSAGMLVPNDVYCSDSTAFQVIQGPNMSGKSTYLKQIGLLAVMAQCGCFVPAEYASLRIHDHLMTRLSNDDDLERNLSTFANEMASCALILGLASSKSLVLIDELGRATSPKEGVGISHAIAEELIKLNCFTFFATHFHDLTVTLSRKPTVVHLHLSVRRSRISTSNIGLTFTYKIVNGLADEWDRYGLQLARLADLPTDVLAQAEGIAHRLTGETMRRHEMSESAKVARRRKAVLNMRTTLTQAFQHSRLPDREFLSYLSGVQKKLTKELGNNLPATCTPKAGPELNLIQFDDI
ncbi:muts domain V-domain-containing protein [Russula earlei]|uniref:Muts domain V-domain-containing protein n=1 Tax=Russula earlei TaxID=71964 RepID=A0ACC0UGJ6_9AGAM|nr:muts domain V-domain-containing protein [Russula earlei]